MKMGVGVEDWKKQWVGVGISKMGMSIVMGIGVSATCPTLAPFPFYQYSPCIKPIPDHLEYQFVNWTWISS